MDYTCNQTSMQESLDRLGHHSCVDDLPEHEARHEHQTHHRDWLRVACWSSRCAALRETHTLRFSAAFRFRRFFLRRTIPARFTADITFCLLLGFWLSSSLHCPGACTGQRFGVQVKISRTNLTEQGRSYTQLIFKNFVTRTVGSTVLSASCNRDDQ